MNERALLDQATGRIAVAIGSLTVATVISLVLFFVVGGPFGLLNDIGNALIGILSAFLALRLAAAIGTGMLGVGAAILGAVVTVIGSWLVITEATGFFLAGLVSSVGFALIGAWLLTLTWSPIGSMSSGLNTLGRVAGVAMLFGLVALPGILTGIDEMGAVPPWLWAFSISWLGIYILYPAWSLWLGRHVLRA